MGSPYDSRASRNSVTIRAGKRPQICRGCRWDRTSLQFPVQTSCQPWSEVAGIAIIGILLALVRTLRMKQNVCCVKRSMLQIFFSCCNLHDMTDSIIEIPKVGVQLPEWLVSWRFDPSQPQRIISGLKETFVKRYIFERTKKAEIRPEEQSEKAESCWENLLMKYSWKGHKERNRHKNGIKRSWQAQLVYVKSINRNISIKGRWACGDFQSGR